MCQLLTFKMSETQKSIELDHCGHRNLNIERIDIIKPLLQSWNEAQRNSGLALRQGYMYHWILNRILKVMKLFQSCSR